MIFKLDDEPDHQLVVCLTRFAIEEGFFLSTIHIMMAVAAESEYLE